MTVKQQKAMIGDANFEYTDFGGRKLEETEELLGKDVVMVSIKPGKHRRDRPNVEIVVAS